MITRRIGTVGAGTILAIVVAATAAQAAYTATGTLVGSAVGSISTIDCVAVTIASTSDDQASTYETVDKPCTSVSVKIYYTNSIGYVGWSSTVTGSSKAVKTMFGSDELKKSYHTATR